MKAPNKADLGSRAETLSQFSSDLQKRKFDQTIVILGPTASGKTGVSIEIAKEITEQQLGGYTGVEIISADSRAIYREMDLGTAKPLPDEQQGIPHWGIDLVNPGERFTVADWKNYAEEKIAEIKGRNHLPMVVGGTGLYIDSLVYDYDFSQAAKETQADRRSMCTNYLLIGVQTDPTVLRQRITERANKLFTQALYDETRELAARYDWNSQAMKSNIYQFAWSYLQGEISLEKAKELFVFDDWHLAKRQLTWFKRNKNIKWLPLAEIKGYVLKCIQDE